MMDKKRDTLRLTAYMMVRVGIILAIIFGLFGAWLVYQTPGSTPNVAAASHMVGIILLAGGLPLAIILVVIGSLLDLAARRRQGQTKEDLDTGNNP